jgi:GYF domain 2
MTDGATVLKGAKMADRQWYTGRDGKQEGPFSDERIRELIASGAVRGDTLVWSEGMANWARAADVPGLMPAASLAPGLAGATGPLSLHVGVWGLFWRAVVLELSLISVIPLPWVAPIFMRWFVERISVPGERSISFAGKPADIWWVFILYALCGLGAYVHGSLPLLLIPVQIFLALLITRWFFANIVWEGQHAQLRFTGGYWAMLGWALFAIVSLISIIGWAWVVTAWARWFSRHVEGSSRQLIFTASGWGYLWRTVVVAVTAIFLIPIPWTLRWLMGWIVSQYALAERDRA